MSDILHYLEKNHKETQRLIGWAYEQLQQFLQNPEPLRYEKQDLLESQKVTIIAGGVSRKSHLSIPEQIILILFYLRTMTTLQLRGIPFGVSESTANDTFNYWFGRLL
ncbi:transposase family protein [Microcoleus sp. Pol12B4]|uniref:transposase family protein n=1 Tax=Microcoleus sp. Pol12B4 TaxID=3055395 RepID=UPI002FD150C4